MQAPEVGVLVGFHAFILLMLALDLGVLQRKGHIPTLKEAAAWSIVWVALAASFAFGIWKFWHLWSPARADEGPVKAVEFVTGYLVELSLSVDNLFVFLVIFRYFGVPEYLRHRVLFWGILGAILTRAAFIVVGAALLHFFHWAIYFFGAFLIYTGYRLLRSVEEEIDPGRNPLLRLAQRFLPVVKDYDSPRFWVRRDGRWYATPLPLVLLVVESTDVVFALDSIPAVFGISKDPFIVYTSNIFAIIGLRSFYFLLANLLGMFRYLNVGLAFVLGFVGLKMIVEEPLHPYLEAHGVGQGTLILASLGVIAAILTTAVVASLIAGPKEPLEHPPEAVVVEPPDQGPSGSDPPV
jgi:tellurite resistance protein TerC